jgi:hypothetical protein
MGNHSEKRELWIERHAGTITTIAVVVQTIIAVLMLKSLSLSRDALKITHRQVEASIEPVLDLSYIGYTNISFQNVGAVSISDLELVAEVGAIFRYQEIVAYQVTPVRGVVIANQLTQGTGCFFNYSSRPTDHLIRAPQTNESRMYCFVFRYKRTVDMKPILKPVFFRNVFADSKSFYLPLDPFQSGGMSSPQGLRFPQEKSAIRKLLEELEIQLSSGHG